MRSKGQVRRVAFIRRGTAYQLTVDRRTPSISCLIHLGYTIGCEHRRRQPYSRVSTCCPVICAGPRQDKRLFQCGSQEAGLVKYDKYTCKKWTVCLGYNKNTRYKIHNVKCCPILGIGLNINRHELMNYMKIIKIVATRRQILRLKCT